MNRVSRLPECDCTVNHNVFKISILYIILRQFTTKLFQVCSKSKTRWQALTSCSDMQI